MDALNELMIWILLATCAMWALGALIAWWEDRSLNDDERETE